MKEVSENNPLFSEEMRLNMINIDQPGKIADFIASILNIDKGRSAADPRDPERPPAHGAGTRVHQEGAGAPARPEEDPDRDQRAHREEPARVFPPRGAQDDQGGARHHDRREDLRLPEVQGEGRVFQVRGRDQGSRRKRAREVRPHGLKLKRVHRDAELPRDDRDPSVVAANRGVVRPQGSARGARRRPLRARGRQEAHHRVPRGEEAQEGHEGIDTPPRWPARRR